MFSKLSDKITDWLSKDRPSENSIPMCDFERIRYEIRPCDVLLIEGRSRVSEVIKLITQSRWSHSAIYIGRVHDISDKRLRKRVQKHMKCAPQEQLLIESILGQGTVLSPLSNYEHDHIRICRPEGISRQDAHQVIDYTISHVGVEYGIRHSFDLARFMLPWSILPRHWRSSLFQRNPGEQTRQICSSLIAEAFASVQFPILPVMKRHQEKGIEFIPRNPRLYTPSDFDYSPYFDIIKYPIFELSERALYRHLPWTEDQHDDEDATGKPKKKKKEKAEKEDSHQEIADHVREKSRNGNEESEKSINDEQEKKQQKASVSTQANPRQNED